MPSPLDILLDPISIVVISILLMLMLIESLFPARALPKTKYWKARSLIVFVIYFYLATYLPLIWDKYLIQYQLFDLTSLSIFSSVLIALLVFEFLIYVWHRIMHESNWLWRIFHQMHHSAERVDTFGAFYFSPLDMVGFTAIGSISLVLIVGLAPDAVTYFLYISTFLAIFQHTNIRTPQWLGYFIQRPESHTVHHRKGVHRYNYSDLPIFDIAFGTFNNPKHFDGESGFFHGASAKIPDMLLWRDVSRSKEKQ